MGGGQSNTRIVYAELDVKSWTARLPSTEEVRPARCPSCGVASRAPGWGLTLHGHGIRSRDQWGPESATAPPIVGEVISRRYRCQPCKAVVQVVPRGILRRRLYSAAAVTLALALWAIDRLTPPAVRRRVSPWRVVGATAARGWASLRRWAHAIRGGELFREVRASAPGATLREVAARTATTLAALAPSSSEALPIVSRAMLGVAHVR